MIVDRIEPEAGQPNGHWAVSGWVKGTGFACNYGETSEDGEGACVHITGYGDAILEGITGSAGELVGGNSDRVMEKGSASDRSTVV